MVRDPSIPPGWSSDAEALTVPYLIRAGNMDASVASVLWALMDRRSSVVVAAVLGGAGKTATLTAMVRSSGDK